MKRKTIDGIYSHFPDEIHGPVDTDAWEAKLTGKQRIGVVVMVILAIGLLALASHYDYWWVANIG